MQEDDLVSLLAAHLRAKEYNVLAAGANQSAAFRFSVADRRKAPDLVAERKGILIVAEGKIRSKSLFLKGPRGFSDYECMELLDACETARRSITAEASSRLATIGHLCCAESLRILPTVFAADHFHAVASNFVGGPVLGLAVTERDPLPAEIDMVYTPAHWANASIL